MSLTEEILSQLPGNILNSLRRSDRLLASIREGNNPVPLVIHQDREALGTVDWDVVICGGTLGILIGCTLAQRGWRVALVERGILRGRDQEWNISRQELEVFLELNILTEAELEQAIATEYNPARVSFHNGVEVWVRDVLNIGIDPVYLLETLKSKFLAAGGKLFENTPFVSATVHPNGVAVKTGDAPLNTRLLLDAMGYASPIVQQARQGKKPDGICLVVGSCATGFPENDTGDLLVSFTPLQNQCQYFWEAFPARDGRTTYLFTYMDAHPHRPTLEDLFEDYLRLMPEYQNVTLDQLQLQRALFGFFPSYQQSPLRLAWNRILPIGDSSSSQSPVSFGGFGAMIRHLQRLTFGIHEALSCDSLSVQALALLQPYQPNISVTWLFQKAMSVGVNQKVAPDQINQLLSAVFQEMNLLGDSVLKPFLQDVVQFPALTKTLLRTGFMHPVLVAKIIPQVGLNHLLTWMFHFLSLGVYSGLAQLTALQVCSKNLPDVPRYYCQRLIDAWKYGSGSDYSKSQS
ncbi:FAD-dependent oxidoreductase [Chroogloeocystis siderophila]|uniref:FAD-dependent oxidoreductase n=1 Tax=Chroogloeocystis siderophila 5.2 s.c.1 TaxID=247279 RepID=A0A1U7HZV0_9CHRO|nr:FAD-dependent oxidoreductase [Chroogloeocystis siderophila]OKH29169.1 FAD-dependent oxidoreductase [Chroogloeocystis siderophila 5.2 s.c.1]